MADHPALLLWTDAYLADCAGRLTDREHGVYLLMMMLAWRDGNDARLPERAELVSWVKQVCRDMHGRSAGVIVDRLLDRFWQVDEQGRFYQKRLEKELKRVRKTSENRSKASRKRWQNQQELFDNNDIADANAMHRARVNPNQTNPIDSESHTNTESIPSRRKPIRGGSARARASAPNGADPPDDAGASEKTNGSAGGLRRGWKPDAETVAKAIAMLGTKTAVQTELQAFHYHHRERPKPQRSRDWNATFLKWCVGEAKRNHTKGASHARKS